MSPERLLLAFIAVSISGGMAAGVMQLLLPLYAISLSVSPAGVGLVRGLAQFGGLTTSLPGGFLIDRFGARRVYCAPAASFGSRRVIAVSVKSIRLKGQPQCPRFRHDFCFCSSAPSS